jgi:hypothetical protein
MAQLTAAQIRKYFLVMGKHIQLSIIGEATGTQYEGHMMATVAQAVSGNAGEYEGYALSISALYGQVAGFVQSAENLPVVAQSAIDNYLQNQVALDMGLSVGLTSPTVLATLVQQMNTCSPVQTVDPSGSNPLGYCNYFNETYAVVLPQASPSGTIPDNLISSVVMV